MFLENGPFWPCCLLRGDWAGPICKPSTAGRSVCTAREGGVVRSPQQWALHIPEAPSSPLEGDFCQQSTRGRVDSRFPWGPPIRARDLGTAFLGVERTESMWWWLRWETLGEWCWSLPSGSCWLSWVSFGSDDVVCHCLPLGVKFFSTCWQTEKVELIYCQGASSVLETMECSPISAL